MDPTLRKNLVLSMCHKPMIPLTNQYATQAQLDEWSTALCRAGETSIDQIVAAVSFIAKTHGLQCYVEVTAQGLRVCGHQDVMDYPPLPLEDDE